VVSFFEEYIRQHARPSEATAFDNLARTAQRSIDRNDKDFEQHLDELKGRNFEILWRQDWFVVERFKSMVNAPHLFADKHRFEELANIGAQLIRCDDIEKLRAVVVQLSMIQIGGGPDNEMSDMANIIRG
jgi:molecular chaperone DnaK